MQKSYLMLFAKHNNSINYTLKFNNLLKTILGF